MKLLALFLLFLATAPTYGQISSPESRDDMLPHPSDFAWDDERVLVVLLENAEDRIVVARLIRDACDLNVSLSNQQRVDGYLISGHSLYSDNALADARVAFDHLLDLPSLADGIRADAYRMLGQIDFLLRDYTSAEASYESAFDLEVAELQAGRPNGVAIVSPMYAYVTQLLGRESDALDILSTALTLLDGTASEGTNDRVAKILNQASRLAQSLGDAPLAISYITRLEQDHPTYGVDDPMLSIPVDLALRKLNMSGHSLRDLNETSSQAALDILQNPNFLSMPLRFSVGETLANELEKKHKFGGVPAASHLRHMLIADANEVLPSITNTIHSDLITRAKARTVLSEARMQIENSNYTTATSLLQNLLVELPVQYADFRNQAQGFLDTIPAP